MVLPNSFPDLPAFKVVPPRPDIRVEDLRLSDGTKMVGPDGLLIPPAREYASIVNTATRVYSYRFDEAMRDDRQVALSMRRDGFMWGLWEERILPSINREWQLEVDDAERPDQRFVRDTLTSVIKSIPDFDCFKRANLNGIWWGRSGCQWAYQRLRQLGGRWGISRWDPLHGDSVQFTFDGVPAILMDTTTTSWYAHHGAKYGPPGQGDLVPTDRGGTALVLHRPYWRDRFSIHVHMREKADYFEGELAGSVQGLGLRGLVYWHYVLRTDVLTWMLAFMQQIGQMDLLVFNYPWNDADAKAQQVANANKIIGKAAIVCPRDPKGNWEPVQQVQMNTAGVKVLHEINSDYFDRHIERLFVGQSMSSGADKGDGLGGTGRSEFTKACVPTEGSEILTRDGFKSPHAVLVGEDVLAYDAESDTCKWTPLLKKSFYEDAEVVRVFDGYEFDALCTPDHSWVVENRESAGPLLKKAHDFLPTDRLVVGGPFDDGSCHQCFFKDGERYATLGTAGSIKTEPASNADVWCPTTKYGTWVMRQNGRVSITGNTKDEILVYDTGRLDSTFTNDLVAPLMRYNFPWANFPVRFRSTMPDVKAKEKVESAQVMVKLGIPVKLEEVRQAGGFSTPKVGDEVIAMPIPGGPPMIVIMGPNGPEPPMQMGGPPGAPGGMPVPGMGQPGMMPPPGIPGGVPGMLGQGTPGQQPPPGYGGAGMVPQVSGSPLQHSAYGPHGGVNAPFYGPYAQSGAIYDDGGTQGGVPPMGGPVMGVPQGSNTYIPGWGRRSRQTAGMSGLPQAGSHRPEPRIQFTRGFDPGQFAGYGSLNRGGPTMYGDREAFEAAIQKNPIDVATHGAYADWLDEAGKPAEAVRHRNIMQWLQNPRVVTVSQHATRGGYPYFGSTEYVPGQTRDGRWTWRKSRQFNDTTAGRSGKVTQRAQQVAAVEGVPFVDNVRHGSPVNWEELVNHPSWNPPVEAVGG